MAAAGKGARQVSALAKRNNRYFEMANCRRKIMCRPVVDSPIPCSRAIR